MTESQFIIEKFFNGFQNGFIFDKHWISHVEEKDQERADIMFLFYIWKLGTVFGLAARNARGN